MKSLASTMSSPLPDHAFAQAIVRRYNADNTPRSPKATIGSTCRSLKILAELEEEILRPARRTPGLDQSDQTVQEKSVRKVMPHIAAEETILLPGATAHAGSSGRARHGNAPHRSLAPCVEMRSNAERVFPTRAMPVAADALLAGACLAQRMLAH